jgi:hypothetical protein
MLTCAEAGKLVTAAMQATAKANDERLVAAFKGLGIPPTALSTNLGSDLRKLAGATPSGTDPVDAAGVDRLLEALGSRHDRRSKEKRATTAEDSAPMVAKLLGEVSAGFASLKESASEQKEAAEADRRTAATTKKALLDGLEEQKKHTTAEKEALQSWMTQQLTQQLEAHGASDELKWQARSACSDLKVGKLHQLGVANLAINYSSLNGASEAHRSEVRNSYQRATANIGELVGLVATDPGQQRLYDIQQTKTEAQGQLELAKTMKNEGLASFARVVIAKQDKLLATVSAGQQQGLLEQVGGLSCARQRPVASNFTQFQQMNGNWYGSGQQPPGNLYAGGGYQQQMQTPQTQSTFGVGGAPFPSAPSQHTVGGFESQPTSSQQAGQSQASNVYMGGGSPAARQGNGQSFIPASPSGD